MVDGLFFVLVLLSVKKKKGSTLGKTTKTVFVSAKCEMISDGRIERCMLSFFIMLCGNEKKYLLYLIYGIDFIHDTND